MITSSSARTATAGITGPDGEWRSAFSDNLTEAICLAFVALYPPIDNQTAADLSGDRRPR